MISRWQFHLSTMIVMSLAAAACLGANLTYHPRIWGVPEHPDYWIYHFEGYGWPRIFYFPASDWPERSAFIATWPLVIDLVVAIAICATIAVLMESIWRRGGRNK
jgi:hypothetical protein